MIPKCFEDMCLSLINKNNIIKNIILKISKEEEREVLRQALINIANDVNGISNGIDNLLNNTYNIVYSDSDLAKDRKISEYEKMIENMTYDLKILRSERNGDVWIWQNDESDDLESLTCPILITPKELFELISKSSLSPEKKDIPPYIEKFREEATEIVKKEMGETNDFRDSLGNLYRMISQEEAIDIEMKALHTLEKKKYAFNEID